jgi:TolA-binding protein
LKEFETVLAEDPELQEQLSLYKEAQEKLQQHFTAAEGEEKLKLTLQDMRKEFFTGEAQAAPVKPISPYRAKVVKAMWRKVTVVAAAAVLLAIFVWKPWEGRDLYTKYAATEMVSPVERGSHADSVTTKAVQAFNTKEFSSAATYLYEIVQADSTNSFAQFYYGVSLLQSGKTEMARATLTKLSRGNSAFKEEAMFYMALSYLKEKDKENCRKWLQQIPAGSGSYAKAKELLERL